MNADKQYVRRGLEEPGGRRRGPWTSSVSFMIDVACASASEVNSPCSLTLLLRPTPLP